MTDPNEVILFDLDGVLFDNAHRASLVPDKSLQHLRTAWQPFNDACDGDIVIPAGLLLLEALAVKRPIIFITSRPKSVFDKTHHAICTAGIKDLDTFRLVMRDDDDCRSPVEYKNSKYCGLRDKGFLAVLAVEDDPEVLAMYKLHGIPTLKPSTCCASIK